MNGSTGNIVEGCGRTAVRPYIAMACATFAIAVHAATPPPLPQPETLIQHATLLTVTHGRIDDGAVLIRGSKIAAFGPAAQVKAGPNAIVIDATGKFVLPGIIDTHSHTAIEGGVNELSLPNTGMVRIHDVIDGTDINVYRELAGGTTAANMLHGSANSIGGQNAVVKWKWGHPVEEWPIPDAPAGIKFALGENPKFSNRPPGSGMPRQYPQTRMGVEEVIRGAFTDARDYMAKWDEYNAKKKKGEEVIPPRKDLLMEEMADILRGKVFVHSHCYRSDEILMLLNVADEAGFKVRTLQHGLEAYKVGREIAQHGTGVGTFIDWWGFKAEAWDATPYNPALLTRSGVSVALNSDSDELARRLNLDAAKAMKYGGVSEEEALKMITLNGAKQLGIDHRMGSIDTGKDADLVIWNAHPLSTYARVDITMVDGEVVFDRARDLERRQALAKERETRLKADKDAEAKEKSKKGDKEKEEGR